MDDTTKGAPTGVLLQHSAAGAPQQAGYAECCGQQRHARRSSSSGVEVLPGGASEESGGPQLGIRSSPSASFFLADRAPPPAEAAEGGAVDPSSAAGLAPAAATASPAAGALGLGSLLSAVSHRCRGWGPKGCRGPRGPRRAQQSRQHADGAEAFPVASNAEQLLLAAQPAVSTPGSASPLAGQQAVGLVKRPSPTKLKQLLKGSWGLLGGPLEAPLPFDVSKDAVQAATPAPTAAATALKPGALAAAATAAAGAAAAAEGAPKGARSSPHAGSKCAAPSGAWEAVGPPPLRFSAMAAAASQAAPTEAAVAESAHFTSASRMQHSSSARGSCGSNTCSSSSSSSSSSSHTSQHDHLPAEAWGGLSAPAAEEASYEGRRPAAFPTRSLGMLQREDAAADPHTTVTPHPQQQQQQQKPRDLVRLLSLGLFTRGKGSSGLRSRSFRLSRSGSSSSSGQPPQQQEQQRAEDFIDWDACCLLQPADELQGAATDCSRRSSSSSRYGGAPFQRTRGPPRRQLGRLQRMASSLACLGETPHRREQDGARPFWCVDGSACFHLVCRSEEEALFPRGLDNLHNTCFLNAALQALAGIPSFVSILQASLPPERWKWEGPPPLQPGSPAAAAQEQALPQLGDEAAAASAACSSSTTATPHNEEARSTQREQQQQRQQEQQELLLQQRQQRRRLLRQLRLQQERRLKQQPRCLANLDDSQRRLLLRELFNQQQDCHEFLRGLIDILHEILKISRWVSEPAAAVAAGAAGDDEHQTSSLCVVLPQQREEEAAAEQLLLMQQGRSAASNLQLPAVSFESGDVRRRQPQQQQEEQQQQAAAATAADTGSTATTPPADLSIANCIRHEGGAPSLDTAGCCPEAEEGALSRFAARADGRPAGVAEDEEEEESDWEEDCTDEVVGPELADKKWSSYLRDHTSPMADFFAGQLCSEIRCAECGSSLYIFEPAWDLSLPLPADAHRVSLTTLMDLFFGAEALEFSCSKCCSSKSVAHRTLSYTHPPRVLLLQIKRFSASGQKRHARVEYPLEGLVVKTGLPHATQAAPAAAATAAAAARAAAAGHKADPLVSSPSADILPPKPPSGTARFRLLAVVEHKGSSSHAGHYVAYVRRRRFGLPTQHPPPAAAAAAAAAQRMVASGRAPTPASGGGPLPSAASSCKAEIGRGSPAELFKRIGFLRNSFPSLSPSLRQPSKQQHTAAAMGETASSRGLRPSSRRPEKNVRRKGSFLDDGTEWFRFDDGLVRPASEAEVLAAEAYCLLYHTVE
ncbi:hypothetical protein Esti_004768 [Eimeria stiedai]